MSNLLKSKAAPNLIDDDSEMEMLAYSSHLQGSRPTNNDQDIYVIGDNMNNILNQNNYNPASEFGSNTQNKFNSTNNASRTLRSNSLANVVGFNFFSFDS